MSQLWIDIAARANVTLDQTRIDQLSAYLDRLFAVNEQMNLTRIENREQAELLHIADSLTVLRHIPEAALRLADVGSGGGLPGIPLAIARPDLKMTLIDATAKKAAFLEQTAQHLGLTNVTVVGQRSEQLRGHQWDVVTARALAAMDRLIQWCLPLVKPGGVLLAMKGPKAREELVNCQPIINRYRGAAPTIHPADLPGRDHLIIEIPRRGGPTAGA
ncbi:MAG TPA: 16S rRNA (guanine(527)-N(7))-methyltransferase RsmG [Tepidisphaeraceae bacterium]|mgnify:CR=1 FL=1|nr:16S rRNA (guanine(527)-N(7))-methyltransferase RsmG [Tepidisphaeraceae bacterium]